MPIRVALNGYGTIGKRMADAIARQPDLMLAGIEELRPNFEIRTARAKGCPVVVSGVGNAADFRATGPDAAGRLDELLLVFRDPLLSGAGRETPLGSRAERERGRAREPSARWRAGPRRETALYPASGGPNVRRTRILATVGPASSDEAVLARLLDAGVDAFRLNFSHGTDAEHRLALRKLRTVATLRAREIAIVADLQGPKVRIGDLTTPNVRLVDGADWKLDATGIPGDSHRASVDLPELAGAAHRGDRILLGDGSVELKVLGTEGNVLLARVIHGGSVAPHAGVFLPNARLRREILGPKDLSDLSIALRGGADFVALSFVRDGADLESARRRIGRAGFPEVGLIAKIERAEALDDIDGILDASDGIMVARGDLGITVPLERLALEQKRLVARANAKHRTVIVATQILLSMLNSPRPTRAEATDVANAVLDGADVVMLSEESAIGAYPVEAVGWLDRICRATESAAARGEVDLHRSVEPAGSVEQSVALAAVELAESLRAAAIVVPTHSGRTARLVASQRPATPVIALSARSSTRRQLALTWGVEAFEAPPHLDLLRLRELAQNIVRAHPGVRREGPIVVTAGYPVEGWPTNLVTVVGPASSPTTPGTTPTSVRVRSRAAGGRSSRARAPGRRPPSAD